MGGGHEEPVLGWNMIFYKGCVDIIWDFKAGLVRRWEPN